MGGHEGLPEAKTAVAAGNFGMSENLKLVSLQPLLEMREQIGILESAATQANTVQ